MYNPSQISYFFVTLHAHYKSRKAETMNQDPTKDNNGHPSLMETAGQMALPVGLMWGASFLCTMYGTERPLVSMLSTLLPLLSIVVLYRQLTVYRRLFPQTGWMHIMRLSLLTSLLAGLLTDAAQYVYFLLFDGGRMLSNLGSAMQSEEYRQAWRQMMPEVSMDEVQQVMQSMTVRDIVMQLSLFNALLALPFSLFAALPVRAPRQQNGENVKTED